MGHEEFYLFFATYIILGSIAEEKVWKIVPAHDFGKVLIQSCGGPLRSLARGEAYTAGCARTEWAWWTWWRTAWSA